MSPRARVTPRKGAWKVENEGLSKCGGHHKWEASFVGDGMNWGMDTEYAKCANCHAYKLRRLYTKNEREGWHKCPRCQGTGRLPNWPSVAGRGR